MTKEINIFLNGKLPEYGIGYHNVGTGVLRNSSPEFIEMVDRRYGARLGHLPPAQKGHFALIEQNHQSPDILEHLKYLSEAYGVLIKPITPLEANNLNGSKVLVPYINTEDTGKVNGNETVRWGLPNKLVNVLKNKAVSHLDMQDLQTDGVEPVEFIVSSAEELPDRCNSFLRNISDNYERAGMSKSYPLGLMIRPEECDGGYGNVSLETTRYGIVYTPDGDDSQKTLCHTWNEAFSLTQKHVKESSKDENPSAVISRLIDVEDSPGMTILLIEGKSYNLGWNGQLFGPNTKACIGTSTFNPKNEYSRQIKLSQEQKSADSVIEHVNAVAKKYNIDIEKVRGILNVDLIIPGPRERNYLSLMQRDTDTIYIAEFNPRWTNGSDAAAAVIWVNNLSHSPENYISTVRGGLLGVDKEKLATIKSNIERYETTLELNRKLEIDNSGVILRMPGHDTVGVIYYGDVQRARQQFLEAMQ